MKNPFWQFLREIYGYLLNCAFEKTQKAPESDSVQGNSVQPTAESEKGDLLRLWERKTFISIGSYHG